MKLTQRDKMLLTIVVLIIVWALGIVFFIKPKIDEVSSKNTALKDVQTQLEKAERDVEAAKTIKDDCNVALKAAQDGAKNFFDVPKAYEAERYLANVLAGSDTGEGRVEITSLSIQGPTAVALSIYNPAQQESLKVPINDAANISGTVENPQNAILATVGETLGSYTYNVNFKAYRADLMKFLTNIKTTENGSSLIVTSLSITDVNVAEDVQLEGSMSFTLYFVKKLEGDNVDSIIEQQLAGVESAQ